MARGSDILDDIFPAWSAGHLWEDAYGGGAVQQVLPWLAAPDADGDDWLWSRLAGAASTAAAAPTPTTRTGTSFSPTSSRGAPTSTPAAPSPPSASSSGRSSSGGTTTTTDTRPLLPAITSATRQPSNAMASPSSSAGPQQPWSSIPATQPDHLSRNAIIGLACAGGVVVLCLGALLAFCLVRRRRRRQRASAAIDISAPWQLPPGTPHMTEQRSVPPVRLHSSAWARSTRPAPSPVQLQVQMQHEQYVHRDGSCGVDEEALQEVLRAPPAGYVQQHGGVDVLGGNDELWRSSSATSSLSMCSSSEKSLTQQLRPSSLAPAPRSPASRARVSPRCSAESTVSISLASPLPAAVPQPASLTHSTSTRAPARPLRAGARTPPGRDTAAAAAEAAGWRLGVEPIASPRTRGPITFAQPLRTADAEAPAQREAVVTARRIPLSYFLSSPSGGNNGTDAGSRAPSMRPGDRQVFPLAPNARRASIASTSTASSGTQSIRASGVHAQLWLSQEHSP